MTRRFVSLFATLAMLMTLMGISAGPAAATDGLWGGNGYPGDAPNECIATTQGTMLWIWTGQNPSSLTINGHTYTGWVQQGGANSSWHLTLQITAQNYPPVQGAGTYVTYTGSAGTLTLSGCNEGTTTPLHVVKTAAGTYDKSIAWTLEKSVDDSEHGPGFPGDSFDSNWTIDVTKTVTEDNFKVKGDITVSNANNFAVTFTVDDVLSDGTVANVDCPTLTVPANDSVVCTYKAKPDGRTADTNTVTVESTIGGDTDSAAIDWTATVIGDTTTDLTDTEGPVSETLTSDFSTTYPGTFPCPTDETLYINGTYEYTVVNDAFLKGDTTDLTDSASVTTTCILRATATVVKVTVPAGGEAGWDMTLTGDFGTETVTTTDANSVAFTTVLDEGDYTITETGKVGWIEGPGSADCTFTVDYPADAGKVFACSFTNTQQAHASLFKTVNGAAIPAGLQILFQLRSGASTDATTGQGTVLRATTVDSNSVFPLDLRGDYLDPGTYQICEFILPGWNSDIRTMPGAFVPASNQPPANVDNSYVCASVTLAAGQNYELTINNTTPPGGMAKTIGFWKNHASCKSSNGKQDWILDQTLVKAGGSIRVGDEVITTCAPAVLLLNKSDLSGKKQASLPEFNFASQYTAYLLNVAAGAYAGNATVLAAATNGQAILDAHSFIGNALTGAKALSAAEKTALNTYAGVLDGYNNNQP